MSIEKNYIVIVNPVQDSEKDDSHEWLGAGDQIKKIIGTKFLHIEPDQLRQQIAELADALSTALSAVDNKLKSYLLDEVEVSATFTTGGKLSLVAGSLEGGVEGGLKFKFKRVHTEKIER